MRVAVFVGTRADLGPLEPVLSELGGSADFELLVLTGVAFDAETLSTYLRSELQLSVPVEQLAEPLQRVDDESIRAHSSSLVLGANRVFTTHPLEALIVLGDRWELLFLVPQAYLHQVPVVHLHGGEVTEGALDERVRHAVTKLADIHCVASNDAAQRVRQLGEPTERVFLTGAPGLDRIATADPLTDTQLLATFGKELPRPIALFTYHPPTLGSRGHLFDRTVDSLRATLDSASSVIVTAPGFDAGREEVLAAIHKVAAETNRVTFVENIGGRFPRVLRSVDVVVGNSSSGIIEAPTAGVPSVDIGDRQQGRLRAHSVTHAPESYETIKGAVDHALSTAWNADSFANPYGDGSAAKKILAATHQARELSRVKEFQDLTIISEELV